MNFQFSLEAEADLVEIVDFIAEDNPDAADRLVADIHAACDKLASKRAFGHPRKDLTPDPDLLFFRVRNCYMIIYLSATEPLRIARVLHGARDVASELAGE